jgi:hypothetical protein
MAMTKKTFRTKQAIEAFEKCSTCETFPASKRAELNAELQKARARFQAQEDAVSEIHSLISMSLFQH